MVTALYQPEPSEIIQKHVEDFEGFGMVRVKMVECASEQMRSFNQMLKLH